MREQIDGHSLDAQEKNIRDYVAAQGWELIEIYTDAGISAKKDSHRPDLENWDCSLPTERKKLLRTAIRAAFLRGNVIEAVQPTDTFMPLVQPKYCNCGEGGIRTRG
jgi:hypothetical protein